MSTPDPNFPSPSDLEPRWDVAVSFAGDDRDAARQVVARLAARGLSVYYDESARAETVGANLFDHLRKVYGRQADCCVAVISKNYVAGGWPKFELQAAQERELIDDGYLLPIRLDGVDVPSLPSSMGYASMNDLDALVERAVRRSQTHRRVDAQSDAAHAFRKLKTDPPSNVRLDTSFKRHVGHVIVEITDPELVDRCRALPEVRDDWSGWRLASDLARYLSWNTDLETGTAYTCWRISDHLFLSMLPGVLASPQRTLEFKFAAATLFLIAQWQSPDSRWSQFAYDEYHHAIHGLMTDRSGLDPLREGSIHALKDRGVTFGFPVVPRPGETEALCGWQSEELEALPFDWDRDPHLGNPRLGVWLNAHHVASGSVVVVFMLYGSWSNAALYAFRDAFEMLLPERHHRFMCGPGAMRIVVLLATASTSGGDRVNEDSVKATVDALYLSLARASAAQNRIPMSSLTGNLEIPRPTLDEQGSLREAIEALDGHEMPKLSDDWAPSRTAEWLKPRHSLLNRVDLAPRFTFEHGSTPSKLRTYISELEGRLAR